MICRLSIVSLCTWHVLYHTYADPDGIGLLCQHTAGCDGRQYRHVLEDRELQASYRLITYDLPIHGRSLPPTEVRDDYVMIA